MEHVEPQPSGWFAVRSVVEHPTEGLDVAAGERLYEERVTLWKADSVDDALLLAEDEDRAYCAGLEATGIGGFSAYVLTVDPGQGAEVFALMRTSGLEPDAYYARHFDTGTERSAAAD
jgi:hypothetical protein